MPHRIFSCFLPCLILTLVTVPATAAGLPDPAVVLAANRAATGAFAAGSVTVRGDYVGHGLKGTVENIFETSSGYYVERQHIPPVGSALGFDGRTPWQTDLSGASTPQLGGDRPALAANGAHRYSNAWWRDGYGDARIEPLGVDANGAHLRITPRAGKPFEAWFDAGTHLLARIREVQGLTTVDVRYRHYARLLGVMVPRITVIDNGSGEADLQTVTLRDVVAGPTQSDAIYAMPATPLRDWSIGGDQTVLPMRLYNDHVYVDVRVNGKGPFAFLVDTGGHLILTPQTAAALSLHAAGAAASSGAGEKTVTSGYTRVHELQAGTAKMRDLTSLVLDFSPKAVEGFQVGGMLGVELFERYVVRIDYGAGTLTLIDPERFDASDAGTGLPFVFYDHLPQVRGAFAGIPARFDIDTGSRAEVTVTRPFVEKHDLRKALSGGATVVDGWGVGGPVRSQVVRAPSLAMGELSVDNITASLATQDKGVFTDENFDGNIGSGWLKRFVVTFDYARQKMYLKPIPDPGPDIGTLIARACGSTWPTVDTWSPAWLRTARLRVQGSGSTT